MYCQFDDIKGGKGDGSSTGGPGADDGLGADGSGAGTGLGSEAGTGLGSESQGKGASLGKGPPKTSCARVQLQLQVNHIAIQWCYN